MERHTTVAIPLRLLKIFTIQNLGTAVTQRMRRTCRHPSGAYEIVLINKTYAPISLVNPHLGHSGLLLLVYTNVKYEGWNFNSGNYLFTTDTK